MSAIPLQRIEGKYEILEKLREGGMGAIYKVRHRLLDEVRVVKVMRPQLVEDEELKARFVREARFAIQLRHPNIAHLYDFTVDEEDGTAFIIMEYIHGLTLEDLLARNGPPGLGLALEIAQQSLKALGYLHGKGFIHRDISPDNLMLTAGSEGEPFVKLIDLGIAKILESVGESHLTQTGTFLGKVRYAPPEQFGTEGSATVDVRGDIYSFGIVLYELLTGRYPIQGRDSASIIAGHLFRPPLDFAQTDPEERLPPGLREVVLKCLAKSPDERFASARELSRALGEHRAPADITEDDLARALHRPAVATEAAPSAPPGSTQERLDQRFVDLSLTPSPRRLYAVEKTPAPAASVAPQPTVQDALHTMTARIEIRLRDGDVAAAEGELLQVIGLHGDRPELRTLRDRVEEARAREIERLLEHARALLGEESFEAAFEPLERARELDPHRAELSDLLARAEGGLRRQAEERQRAERLAEAVAEIAGLLAKGAWESAGELLDRAEGEHGEAPDLAELRGRWERARRQARRAKAADEVAGARAQIARRDLEGAITRLRRAAELDPENADAPVLLAEAQAGLRRSQERERLAAAVVEIRDCLERRDLEAAGRLLAQALARHGASAELDDLGAGLDRLRRAERLEALRNEAEQRLAAGDPERAESVLHLLLDLDPEAPGARRLQKRIAEELRRRREAARPEPRRAPEPPPAEPPRVEPAAPPRAEARAEPQGRPQPVPPSRPQPPPRGRRRMIAAAAALLLAVLAAGGLWLRSLRDGTAPAADTPAPVSAEPAPSPSGSAEPASAGGTASQPAPPPPSSSEPPAVALPGELIVDAVPWGEVVRVENAAGDAVAIGPDRYTPLVLSLPPGRYRLTLRGPGSRAPREVAAVVAEAGHESAPVLVTFRRIDAESYFRDLGF